MLGRSRLDGLVGLGESKKKPKFLIEGSRDGGFYFVLVAENGEIIAISETYKSIGGAKNGIKAVRRCAPIADGDDQN